MIKTYWRLSKWDALVWVVTFFTTVFVDISIGLGAGIVVSLFSIFIQGYTPYACLLGVVPNTDLYLDVKRYKGVSIVKPKIRELTNSHVFLRHKKFLTSKSSITVAA